MSLIYYKLKNAIQQNSVTFDGSVIQIGDVKRLVAEKQGLGSEGYQEITLYDPNTGDEYDNDSKVIPRNTLVEVKRKPAATFAPLTSQQNTASAKPLETNTVLASAARPVNNEGGGTSQDLEDFAKGTASTWQREVRQGVLRGRGRGRGVVPAEYRCPRCEVFGAHWIQDCPTHGDPTYDKKRVRPPVGIPMTRLARSTEGGLVLPDGNTGTLIANEDAFAREVLGIGDNNVTLHKTVGIVAIEGKKQAEHEISETKQQQAIGFMPFSISSMSATAPQLAGMKVMLKDITKKVDEKDGQLFQLLKYPELPRGPKDFLLKAYNRDSPLSRKDFEREQDYYLDKSESRSKKSSRRYRSRSRSPSMRRHVARRHDRSRSRSSSRTRYKRSKSTEERRHRSTSRDKTRRSRRNESRKDSGHLDEASPVSQQKSPANHGQARKTKEDRSRQDDGNKTKSQRKHSPIRWSKPVSPRKGANFAGQDEEPDLDYGESDDNSAELTDHGKDRKTTESFKNSTSHKERYERSHKNDRAAKNRRERGGQRYPNGKGRTKRH